MTRGQKIYLGIAAALGVGYIALETSGWAAGGKRRDPIDKSHLAASQRSHTNFGGYVFYRGIRGK